MTGKLGWHLCPVDRVGGHVHKLRYMHIICSVVVIRGLSAVEKLAIIHVKLIFINIMGEVGRKVEISTSTDCIYSPNFFH